MNLAATPGRFGVLVLAIDDVRYGLEPAMRMIRCADSFARCVDDRAQFVNEQEWIDLQYALHRERTMHEKTAALAELLGRQHE